MSRATNESDLHAEFVFRGNNNSADRTRKLEQAVMCFSSSYLPAHKILSAWACLYTITDVYGKAGICITTGCCLGELLISASPVLVLL